MSFVPLKLYLMPNRFHRSMDKEFIDKGLKVFGDGTQSRDSIY